MNEPTLVRKDNNYINKQKHVLIIAVIAVVTLFIGSSYALLTNFDTTEKVVNIKTGNLSVTINNTVDLIDNELNDKLPESDTDGINNSKPITITITNNGTLNIEKYEVKLVSEEGKVSTLGYDCIKYVVSDGNVSNPTNLLAVKNVVYTGYDLNVGESKTITLKLWLDEASGNKGLGKTFYGAIDVKLYQKNEPGHIQVLSHLTKTNDVPDNYVEDTDGTIYISGCKEDAGCDAKKTIDFNYVWYSGKLWRIVAIYPDGSMKLVTEDAITSIYWGSNAEVYYDTTNNVGSWVYQWLNEDFYDTLVKADDYLIKNASWNYSTDSNSTPVNPSTIETQKTTNAAVGLLNAYEYAKGYANAATDTNYLNIGYYWWLITPYSSSNVRGVRGNGGGLFNSSPSSSSSGVRPSIYLKSDIGMKGTGTKTDPYRINDNELASANTGNLLNSRMSGEYVKFDNDLYRIVNTENNITKLIRVDYLRDTNGAINKHFTSTVYFGKTGNTETDTYWDYYLNNTWYDSISSNYQNMMVDGTYYLGVYQNSNYKITICSDDASTLDNKVTKLGVEGKSCTRYTSSNADSIFTGKVGLQRVGEMFSAQLGSGYSSSSIMWLITPYSSSRVHIVNYYGYLNDGDPSGGAGGVRPSINLASNVKITSGTGLYESPYEIEYTPGS